MNKQRLKRIESRINRKRNIELPLFLDTEGEVILFLAKLLLSLETNPEDYPAHKGGSLSLTPEGRKVPRKAPFISHYSGETWAPDCYIYLKGYEDKPIILT